MCYPWGRNRNTCYLWCPYTLYSGIITQWPSGHLQTEEFLNIKKSLSAGETALAGTKLPTGWSGRQRHDQDQCPRHQGCVQVMMMMMMSRNNMTKINVPDRCSLTKLETNILPSGTRLCSLSSPTYSSVSFPTEIALSQNFAIVIKSNNFLHISHFPHFYCIQPVTKQMHGCVENEKIFITYLQWWINID